MCRRQLRFLAACRGGTSQLDRRLRNHRVADPGDPAPVVLDERSSPPLLTPAGRAFLCQRAPRGLTGRMRGGGFPASSVSAYAHCPPTVLPNLRRRKRASSLAGERLPPPSRRRVVPELQAPQNGGGCGGEAQPASRRVRAAGPGSWRAAGRQRPKLRRRRDHQLVGQLVVRDRSIDRHH